MEDAKQNNFEQIKTQNNPFSQLDSYNGNFLPDSPIPFAGSMIDSMLNNDEVPETVRTKNWWIFHKDNVLGFLDEQRKKEKLMNFDIIKIDSLATMRRKDYTFDTELNFDIMLNVFETKLDRSVGVNNASSIINERKSLISQISENRSVSESDDGLVKESFIRKLIGKSKR